VGWPYLSCQWLALRAAVLRRAVSLWSASPARGNRASASNCGSAPEIFEAPGLIHQSNLLAPAAAQGNTVLGQFLGVSKRSTQPLLPNPSLKPSTNGGPPGPGHRYGVHFLWPGPGVPPLVPA
jgi:hypothetical protein